MGPATFVLLVFQQKACYGAGHGVRVAAAGFQCPQSVPCSQDPSPLPSPLQVVFLAALQVRGGVIELLLEGLLINLEAALLRFSQNQYRHGLIVAREACSLG